jgi:hypothetical protein
MPYTDATGKIWPLAVDLPAARRVRDLVGVNLLTLRVDALVYELSDPIRLCEVLWAISKPEAEAAGLDLDQFLRRMAVDLTPITSRLLGELADFFQRLGQTEKATQMRMTVRTLKTLPMMTTEQMEILMRDTTDWMIEQATLIVSSGSAATSGQPSSA